MFRYLVGELFRSVWSLNASFPFRYIVASFAAASVAQLLFGVQLIVWIVASVAAFLIGWISSPYQLREYYKVAILYLFVAVGVYFFTPVDLIAIALASLAAPVLWQGVVLKTILKTKNRDLDAVITLLNCGHVLIVLFFLLDVFLNAVR